MSDAMSYVFACMYVLAIKQHYKSKSNATKMYGNTKIYYIKYYIPGKHENIHCIAFYLHLAGYDRRPGSYAVRILSCFWMSFCLITIISYIGSASNHMFWADSVRRVDPMESPVTNLRDLIEHKDGYNYGTVR